MCNFTSVNTIPSMISLTKGNIQKLASRSGIVVYLIRHPPVTPEANMEATSGLAAPCPIQLPVNGLKNSDGGVWVLPTHKRFPAEAFWLLANVWPSACHGGNLGNE